MNNVEVGRIGKPFGIRGEVYVHPEPDLGDVITTGAQLIVDDGIALTVRKSFWHGPRFIVAFEGYTDRNLAETLRGKTVFVAREEVSLDEDAMWVSDMVGTQVILPSGELVGEVNGVRDGTAHDWILLTTLDGKERLIPHVAAIIDVSQTPFVIDPPEGLLELE